MLRFPHRQTHRFLCWRQVGSPCQLAVHTHSAAHRPSAATPPLVRRPLAPAARPLVHGNWGLRQDPNRPRRQHSIHRATPKPQAERLIVMLCAAAAAAAAAATAGHHAVTLSGRPPAGAAGTRRPTPPPGTAGGGAHTLQHSTAQRRQGTSAVCPATP
jgi:hypothetical protein